MVALFSPHLASAGSPVFPQGAAGAPFSHLRRQKRYQPGEASAGVSQKCFRPPPTGA
jgi:hypothetical protein